VKSQGAGFYSYLWPKPGFEQPVSKISYVKGFAPWGWIIGTGIYLDDVDVVFRQTAMMFGIMALILFAVVLLASVIISRSVTKPLNVITDLTGRLAAGDQSFEVPYAARKDEIGGRAKALSGFKDNGGAMAKMDGAEADMRE